MDEGCSRAVREVFIRLYEQGLIYRDYYIVNWCPRCHTTISDIEVEHLPVPGHLYYIKYPAKRGGKSVIIATTRPETMLGDVAVAVHPEDERFKSIVGETLILPLVGREMPVIADEYVDREFGTGALKITPAHDPNDFEVGKRHNLDSPQVIGPDAAMTENAGEVYRGLDRWECRKRIIKDLDERGYLIKIEDHEHAVGHCYRCHTVIEPMLSRQWFVKMDPLAKPAIEAVRENRITYIPERFGRIYLNWMENIRDWCISRQLWWGHRIPVWYCLQCDNIIASSEDPASCPRCGGKDLEQDPDVLDTWFSSALWPFSTLGWPGQTEELNYYYPTSVMVTGRDIIFFWVARMIFSGLAFMNEVPFKEVFVHGLVMDALGRKMSKSLGNGVDPIDVIEEYGADSLRFMLVTGNTPGNDLRFHFERLDGARNFVNKIWNASRFVIMNLQDFDPGANLSGKSYTLADRWILSHFRETAFSVTACLENYELGEAARIIYEFTWNEFCDWYVELCKSRLYGEDLAGRQTARHVLVRVLKGTLELLHPFMPFITEDIWQRLPHQGETIMKTPWPEPEESLRDPVAESGMADLMEITRSIRRLRSEMNVPPGKKAAVILLAPGEHERDFLDSWSSYLEQLAACRVEVSSVLEQKPARAIHAVARGVEIFMPLEGLIDIEKEIARLEKDLLASGKDLQRTQGKLNNENFLKKAAPEIVEKEKTKEAELKKAMEAVSERLEILKG